MDWPYRRTVLVLTTLAFFSTMVARLVISPVVPDITGEFGVSTSAIGLSLTGMWAAYALAQFPSGLLGDRIGERRVILSAVGLTGVASALLSVAPSFAAFTLVVVLLGAAAGLHYSVATTLLTKQFDDIGRAIGVHVAGGPLAGLLAPITAAVVGSRFGWRAAIVLGAGVAIPVFVTFARTVRPTPPSRPEQSVRERLDLGVVVELLSRPAIAYTTVLAIIGAFAWQATASFLPTFLDQYRGLSQTAAGAAFSAYFVIHGATQPVTGGLSDRIGRDAAVAATMAVGVLGYALLVVGSGTRSLVVGIGLVALAMSWGAPLQSRFMDNLASAERGAGFGLVRTVYMVVGALGSVVVGVIADVQGWFAAFGLLATLMAVALAAIVANRTFHLGL